MIDRNSPTPLHQQLEDLIRESIANEEWAPDKRIPSENELATNYGLSRMTARGVITRLTQEGLLYRVNGKGTFVATPKLANRTHLPVGIQHQLEEQGIENTVRLISVGIEPVTGRARRHLQLQPGDEVWRVERLREIADGPLSIHRSYVPASRTRDLDKRDLASGDLRGVLDRDYGLVPSIVEESIETALAGERDAALLGVKTGFTLLQMEEVNRDEDDRPYEYCHVLFRGDKMKITFEFSRANSGAPARV